MLKVNKNNPQYELARNYEKELKKLLKGVDICEVTVYENFDDVSDYNSEEYKEYADENYIFTSVHIDWDYEVYLNEGSYEMGECHCPDLEEAYELGCTCKAFLERLDAINELKDKFIEDGLNLY